MTVDEGGPMGVVEGDDADDEGVVGGDKEDLVDSIRALEIAHLAEVRKCLP